MAQAETVFEYRSRSATIPYEQRVEFKQGFFLYFDKLWETINLRNEVFQYTDGLLRFEVPAINEAVAREAILNAIAHRDYRLSGSIFIRQFPKRLEIVSPGGLPPGITVENLLWRQAPRNRRLAEVFARCGLVERAGQGANRMFEQSIRESKPLPDFSDGDDYQVSVVLNGEVGDENFLRFLEAVGRETASSFTTEHLLLLDLIHREQAVPERLKPSLRALADTGVVENSGSRPRRSLLAVAEVLSIHWQSRGIQSPTRTGSGHEQDAFASTYSVGQPQRLFIGRASGRIAGIVAKSGPGIAARIA